MTTTTASTPDNTTDTKVIGKHGELRLDEPEQLLIEQIRDYLATNNPDRFMPNWDEMSKADRTRCLSACANSRTYMNENVISFPEISSLLAKLDSVTDRTDPQPDHPGRILEDFACQADRRVPEWSELPRTLRLRFTDYYHHSENFKRDGKLGWLDVGMMLTFAMSHGYFLDPASLEDLRANLK